MANNEVQVEHLESETSHEYVLSVYFASLLVLLMVAIVVSNYVSHRLRLQWLPEAAGKPVLNCALITSFHLCEAYSSTLLVS